VTETALLAPALAPPAHDPELDLVHARLTEYLLETQRHPEDPEPSQPSFEVLRREVATGTADARHRLATAIRERLDYLLELDHGDAPQNWLLLRDGLYRLPVLAPLAGFSPAGMEPLRLWPAPARMVLYEMFAGYLGEVRKQKFPDRPASLPTAKLILRTHGGASALFMEVLEDYVDALECHRLEVRSDDPLPLHYRQALYRLQAASLRGKQPLSATGLTLLLHALRLRLYGGHAHENSEVVVKALERHLADQSPTPPMVHALRALHRRIDDPARLYTDLEYAQARELDGLRRRLRGLLERCGRGDADAR